MILVPERQDRDKFGSLRYQKSRRIDLLVLVDEVVGQVPFLKPSIDLDIRFPTFKAGPVAAFRNCSKALCYCSCQVY